MRLRFFALAALTLATAAPSHASFHLFDIQEIYSNLDGSVQFIELFSSAGGQQFLSGHQLTFDIGSTANKQLTFATNLPGDTLNKTVLIGTSNLTALYGVTPDYVIAANFLTKGANNFANFGRFEDRVTLSALPLDGVMSINGNVSNSTETVFSINPQATPRNFAGLTATIPEPASAALLLVGWATVALRRRRLAS